MTNKNMSVNTINFTTINIRDDEIINEKLSFLKPYLDVDDTRIIAGGCFKDIFTGKPVKDIDIYNMYPSFKQPPEMINNKYDEYDNNIRITIPSSIDIDIIKCLHGSPESILLNFDFTVCMFSMYKINNEYYVTYHHKFFNHLNRRRLKLNTLKQENIYSTFLRAMKYSKYGYRLESEDVRSIITQIQTCERAITLVNIDELYSNFD